MKLKIFIVFLIISCLACTKNRIDYSENMKEKPKSEINFNKEKWLMKEGKDYPYRDKMLNDIVYNDTVRSLNKAEILVLFGEQDFDRNNEDYLYYLISQKRLFSWPLHTRTMVIKFCEDSIEWIKIHE